MTERLRVEILSELNDAWLNINYNKNELCKPFDLLTTDDPEEFYKTFTWLMIQPEYFCFLCKNILNIDLVPFQGLMLEEIWKRKFPMLIGSRGVGKATKCTEPLLTDQGWVRMGDITYNHKVYSRNGKLCNIVGIYPQGKKQVCRLKFADGREIDCCEDHLWVMKKQQKEVTVSTKDIINDGVRFYSSPGKWAYKYKLPLTEPIQYEEKQLPLDPYILGCLLGDGCMTTRTPKIASDDAFIIEQFRTRLDGFEIKKDSSNNNYTIVDIDKQLKKRCSKKGKSFYKRDGNRLVSIIEGMKLNVGCKDKFIPEEYKTSSVEQRMEIVRGLLDTDGSCNKNGAIEFTNSCEKLVKDLIEVLRSLGISCQLKIDDRSGSYSEIRGKQIPRNPYYRVFINTSKQVFKLPRKVERLKNNQTSREKYTSLISAEYVNEFEEMQCISVDSPDHTYITKDYIVTHNTFLLSLYSLMRALIMPERKVVVIGAAFRQSKFLHEYMETIWKKSPILRDLCDSNSGPRRDVDMCRMIINSSTVTAIPVGDGQKIRGLRANDIIADEFASQSRDIFENVIAGFGAVSSSPSEGVKLAAAKNLAKQRGYDLSLLQENFANEDFGNQIVLSGTAYYDFNHFSTYWKRWRSIINSKGDPVKLKETFGEEKVPDSFNWKDYSVIRMPFELIPKGFMDDAQVARSKATVHNGIYLMEFSAVFCTDSAGFFKRSLIEACTGSEQKPIKLPSGDLYFDPSLKGQIDKQYIIGVDPASEVDNFSIVVLEVNSDHRRIAHVWTTTRKEYNERLKRGLTEEGDFYAYCARRIRDLMGAFPTIHIAMDAQGGGIAVAEALHDPVRLLPGELPIWPVIDEDKEKDTDDEQGLHILELCQFAKYDWLSEANHGLRKDLEDKVLLFPRFDPITIGLSIEQDKASNRTYDTLEDCVMEIEALKDELCLIEIRQTPTGRDQWNTPEVKTGVGKKDRLRKDRYSALLMANMAARQARNARIQDSYEIYGGFASVPDSNKKTEAVFLGPNWYTEKMNGVY